MFILNGIKNFLELLNNNWTTIVIIVGLTMSICKRVDAYMAKSDNAKIELAKSLISETMLKYVTKAEDDYKEWAKAGAAKRAQVIDEILAAYPVLKVSIDRDEIIAWIDVTIDEALKTMREMLKNK